MQGTTLTKIGRALNDLSKHPQLMPKYIRSQWSTPLALGLPWLSFSAIEFLNRRVAKTAEVFEFGAGGSTVFFAERCTRVVSAESHAGWAELVRQKLVEKNLQQKVEIRETASLKEGGLERYTATLAEPYDVILIDSEEPFDEPTVRPALFERAQDLIRPGGMIIVDDAWRYDDAIRASRAKEVFKLQSVGPCRPGVTRTDVYIY